MQPAVPLLSKLATISIEAGGVENIRTDEQRRGGRRAEEKLQDHCLHLHRTGVVLRIHHGDRRACAGIQDQERRGDRGLHQSQADERPLQGYRWLRRRPERFRRQVLRKGPRLQVETGAQGARGCQGERQVARDHDADRPHLQ